MTETERDPWWIGTKVPEVTASKLALRLKESGGLDALARDARHGLAFRRSLEAADTFRLIAAVDPQVIFTSSQLLGELHKYFGESDAALQLSLVRVLGLVGHPSSEDVIERVASTHVSVKKSPMLSQACREALGVIQGSLNPADTDFINPDSQ